MTLSTSMAHLLKYFIGYEFLETYLHYGTQLGLVSLMSP